MYKKILLAALLLCLIPFSSYAIADSGLVQKDSAGHAQGVVYNQVMASCIGVANKETESKFMGFAPEQITAGNTEYKMNNAVIRFWYLSFLRAFNNQWKGQLENRYNITPKEYALLAYTVRHKARMIMRDHMEDAASLRAIQKRDLKKYGNQDGPTFKWLVYRQLQKQQGGSGTEQEINLNKVYRGIIESSTRTNAYVNIFMRCYDYLPSGTCDYVGGFFSSDI